MLVLALQFSRATWIQWIRDALAVIAGTAERYRRQVRAHSPYEGCSLKTEQ
jgi:hypothetical protein